MEMRSVPMAVVLAMLCGVGALPVHAQKPPTSSNAIQTLDGPAAPRLIKRVDPAFPGIALTEQTSGDVVMTVTVGADGTVKDVKVVHGLPQLIRSAVHAVSQWQYEPFRINGVATAVKTTVTVHYSVAPNPIGVADSAERGVGIASANPALKAPLPPPPAGVLRISAGVMDTMVEKTVEPIYPEDSAGVDAQGVEVLLVSVGKMGEVSEAEVLSGPTRFRQAALDAIKQWKYRPYEVDGAAVEVQTTVRLMFAPRH